MKHATLNVAALAVAAALSLAGCKKNEPATPPAMPEPTAPAPAPAAAPMTEAVSVQGVGVGTVAAADKSVATQAVIGARDPIIVSVRTFGTASNVPVVATLTYQDGQVAGEQHVSLNTSGPDTTNITFSNSNAWPAGTYTAQVTVNGMPAGTAQQFEVR